MYNDKSTGRPKGEATVTYDDAHSANSAISWFNGLYSAIFIYFCILLICKSYHF